MGAKDAVRIQRRPTAAAGHRAGVWRWGRGVLILDEALSNLDAMNQALILKLLADLQCAHSLAYLHMSHDLRLVPEFADEVAVMYEGRIVEQQGTRELFASPEHSYTKDLLATVQAVESILLQRSA